MESFLRGEISMSSSRNEPRINRPARANAPVRTAMPPVREQEVIDVEAVPVEPIVPAAARAVDATRSLPGALSRFSPLVLSLSP